MKKSYFGKEALTLAIMTVLTVIMWIVFDVYRANTKHSKSKVTTEQLAPLTPRLNKETIDALKESLTFSDEEMDIATESSPIDTTTNPDTM